MTWFAASGGGTLYSYVINHRLAPGFTAPYSIAVVELDEGPRLLTNIVNCAQTTEAPQLDMRVEVVFGRPNEAITYALQESVRQLRGTAGGTSARRPNLGSAPRRRRVRCQRHSYLGQPSPVIMQS